MRVAYCIVCHKNNPILRETIKLLQQGNDIYLHIDKKSDLSSFDEYIGRVYFIDDRIDVKWGNISLVKAMVKLLNETCKREYDYIFFLSGECLPLRTNEKIMQFLEKNNGKEFIGIDVISNTHWEERVKYNYSDIFFEKTGSIMQKAGRKIYKRIKFLFKNPYYKELPKIYYGCNWFGITKQLRDYILLFLKENPNYIRAFKKAFCPDELFFQTIVMNSSIANNIHRIEDRIDHHEMALRYVDWKSGPDHPKILNEQDYNKMIESQMIFARKVNSDLDIERYEREILGINIGVQVNAS